MKTILGFLITAIKCLSKPIIEIKDDPDEPKYVIGNDVLKAIELTYYHWLDLSRRYRETLKFKKSESLHELHVRVQALSNEYEELNDFELEFGDPFFYLMRSRSLTKAEMIEKYGEKVVCIELNRLTRLVVVILDYTFLKKYKDRATDDFGHAESQMKRLVEQYKLPGRFSWNAFVPKEKKIKSEPDFSFLESYNESGGGLPSLIDPNA